MAGILSEVLQVEHDHLVGPLLVVELPLPLPLVVTCLHPNHLKEAWSWMAFPEALLGA